MRCQYCDESETSICRICQDIELKNVRKQAFEEVEDIINTKFDSTRTFSNRNWKLILLQKIAELKRGGEMKDKRIIESKNCFCVVCDIEYYYYSEGVYYESPYFCSRKCEKRYNKIRKQALEEVSEQFEILSYGGNFQEWLEEKLKEVEK